jgi:hypothetical protein
VVEGWRGGAKAVEGVRGAREVELDEGERRGRRRWEKKENVGESDEKREEETGRSRRKKESVEEDRKEDTDKEESGFGDLSVSEISTSRLLSDFSSLVLFPPVPVLWVVSLCCPVLETVSCRRQCSVLDERSGRLFSAPTSP